MEKVCVDCGREPIPTENTTGYGTASDGNIVCFECIAYRDMADMMHRGDSKRLPLYLSKDNDGKWTVGNWPGTLKFPVAFRTKGQHNIARTREDVWFRGPDQFIWHGVQYGEWTQVCHCKRTKQTKW